MRRGKISLYGFAVLAMLSVAKSVAAELNDIQIIKGKCDSHSHIAEGKIGGDLTKRQSRFYCNTAVIAFFDNNSKHLLIQFGESESHHNPLIGFAGFMEDNNQVLDIEHVYLEADQPVPVSEGFCKFFFKDKHMSSISCGAKIDEDGRRTVPIISFTAAPGQ